MKQWVCWKLVQRKEGKKPTKIPLNPRNLEMADTTNPETWGTFSQALKLVEEGKANGIGFVFSTSDPYVGIDLDHCLDPETGELKPWAREIISALDSYSEVSPSGQGVHIIAKGRLPGHRRRKGNIEMYSEGRYFTMTGNLHPGSSKEIEERSAPIEQVYWETFDEGDKPATNGPHVPSSRPDDDELLHLAMKARNGSLFRKLWQGDWSDYSSQSETDLALCSKLTYWTNRDGARIDALVRRSGLMRSKWDEKHGEDTYGQMTIRKALSGAPLSPDSVQPSLPKVDVNAFPLTDAGNAELFAGLYREQIRYDHSRNRWLIWREHRWAPDADGHVYRIAKEAARIRYRSAESIQDQEKRKKVASFAISSESRSRIDSCLALAKNEHPIADAGVGWDGNPMVLGVANGVIDLTTGLLSRGLPKQKITMYVPIEYDPHAGCPRWLQFLEEVFDKDKDLISFIRRAVGYSLTGSVKEQILFLCHGTGSNGKSVFLSILRHLAGDYALNIAFTVLELQHRASVSNDLAALVGRRLVTSSETSESTRLNEARIKAITGGDPITARFLYNEQFTFYPLAKFWLAVNHLPRVKDDSIGFWRRVRVIPYTRQFSGADQDPDLVERLKQELPGILAWAVSGAMEWQKLGLVPPQSVQKATEAYQEESDDLALFISDRCVVDISSQVMPADFYSEYQSWAEEQGIVGNQRLTSNAFGRRMKERFGPSGKSNGQRHYKGVGILSHREGRI